jgi:hypothetical protein
LRGRGVIIASRNKKKTPNQQEYDRQIRRLKSNITRIRNQGFTVNFEMPIRPKRITKKKLHELSEIKTSDIYAQSTYIDPQTGELLTGQLGVLRSKQRRTERVQRGKIVLDNLQQLIRSFRVTPAKNVIEKVLEGIPLERLANALDRISARGYNLDWYAQYKADVIGEYTWELGKEAGLSSVKIMELQEGLDEIVNYTMDWSYIR